MNKEGISVLKHNKLFSTYFKEICLDHTRDIEDLAYAEGKLSISQRNWMETRREYFDQSDEFCSMLKKRADRPLPDDEDEPISEGGQSKSQRK